MLKLVRNVLGDTRKLENGNGDWIMWDFFVKLHDLQEYEGMHLSNKLRRAHVYFLKQKMKVRLAAQLFSKSIAHSLRICKDDLKLSSFVNCGATIEFIEIINDLFDILNSRNLKNYGFKRALNSENKEEIFQKLDEIVEYFKNLKFRNGGSIIKSRKNGFIGFLICIESLKNTYEQLCENSSLLKYILTYKISQDHLETLFSCIRSHWGHNNNPTVQQFSSVYKKILLHTEFRAAETGNCISLEHISILHISVRGVYVQWENIINASCEMYRACNNIKNSNWIEACDSSQIHSYVPNILQITEFSKRVIAYMAGFVVKHLKSKLHCESCISALIGSPSREAYSLIALKNYGGLCFPSDDVFLI